MRRAALLMVGLVLAGLIYGFLDDDGSATEPSGARTLTGLRR